MYSTCRECGGRFVKTVWNKKFCSRKCKNHFFHKKYRKSRLKYSKQFRKINPKYFKEWEKKNKDKRKYILQRYEIRHPTRRKKISQRYRNKHPKRVKQILHKYRGTPKGIYNTAKCNFVRRSDNKRVQETWTATEWYNKKVKTFGVCPSCNRYVGINKITIDHTPSLKKAPNGFNYTIKDIQPLCQSCNSRKGASI